MQETITTTPDDELPPSRPRRFRLIALGLVLTMFVPFAYIAYRNIADAISNPDPAPNPGFPEPDFSLTDEQAVETLERLENVIRSGIAQRDVNLISQATTSNSGVRARLADEIARLKKDGVVDESRVESLNAIVIDSSPQEIRIREIIRIHPCFRSEAGKDVTRGDAEIEQTGVWILRLESSKWLIEDVIFEDDKVINTKAASCET